MLLVEFFNPILTEADVFDPLCPDPQAKGCTTVLDRWIHEMGEDLEDFNPYINHGPFLERLKKDIVNNNRIFGATGIQGIQTALEPFTPSPLPGPQAKLPDWVKNKPPGTIFTVSEKALTLLHNELLDLFVPDEGEPTSHPLFYTFHNLVKDAKTLDPAIRNKLVPLKQKYEQGKFDLPGLKNAMQVMTQLGAQKWKYDSTEKQRLETEAPIIMKFKNGMKWVRLDSKEEMQREGDMMQNCISGYCPVGEEMDITFGLRAEYTDEYELDEQGDDTVYEWLEQWVEENGRIQDYLMDKVDDDPANIYLSHVIQMSDDEAFEWMATQIIEADADIETGAPPGGHLIYSLRDKNGESHISAEYDPDVDMNYIQPTEALGKQNDPPVKKYKPYIQKLDDFFTNHPETFGTKGNTKDMPFHPDYDDDRVHST
jgi:hypothetical protein